jgi:kynurenine formamidase
MRKATWMTLVSAMALVAGACQQAPAPADGTRPAPPPVPAGMPAPQTIIDLGHALSEKSPTWTGGPLFSHKVEKGPGYIVGTFSTDEHFGTHFDAPMHFGGEWSVDKVPAERLTLVPGVSVQLGAKVLANEDYRVTRADIEAYEKEHGRIPDGAVVFIATGWESRWGDPVKYRNERSKVKHFPGLSLEAANFLAVDRKVAGIGIDTLSVDYGPSTEFEVHRATQPRNVYHIENATNLGRLPPKDFRVIVAPVKVEGGSGAPTRVFAVR